MQIHESDQSKMGLGSAGQCTTMRPAVDMMDTERNTKTQNEGDMILSLGHCVISGVLRDPRRTDG